MNRHIQPGGCLYLGGPVVHGVELYQLRARGDRPDRGPIPGDIPLWCRGGEPWPDAPETAA